MDPLEKCRIGQTELHVTRLGFGGATLGDAREVLEEAQAGATLAAAYQAGITYFDTAPWYGNTKSEHRLGRFLRTQPRDSFVVSTKVGRVYSRPRDPRTFHENMWAKRWAGGLPFEPRFDYTRGGVLRSYEDSLQRLGLNTVDALLIHDLDFGYHLTEAGVQAALGELDAGGGFAALAELKRNGEIRAIGAGINHTGMIPRFLERFDPDFFLVAMPYTLLDQDALDVELPLCASRNVSIVIGAPFASGLLAGGATYGYQSADDKVLARTRGIEAVCARHNVPLGAAALQFPFGHSTVAAVIPGPNSPAQAQTNLEWMRVEIPNDLWAELKREGLLRTGAPTP